MGTQGGSVILKNVAVMWDVYPPSSQRPVSPIPSFT